MAINSLIISRIILGSQSPWRLAILQKAGVPAVAIPSTADENAVRTADGAAQALGRAEIKALAVARLHPDALVIGADQVLSLGSRNFDKAANLAEATEHLTALSGKTHTLNSAFVLARGDETLLRCNVPVAMAMRRLTTQECDAYLRTGEWEGSVGCYKIEGRGAQLFEGPIGDYFSIIGMPIAEVCQGMRDLGVDLISSAQGPWTLKLKP